MRPVYFPASLFTYHFIFSPTCQALYIPARHFFVWFTFNRLFCFSLIFPLSTLSSYLLHSTRSSPSQYFESSNATETHRFTLQLSPSGRSDSSPLYLWVRQLIHTLIDLFAPANLTTEARDFPQTKLSLVFRSIFPYLENTSGEFHAGKLIKKLFGVFSHELYQLFYTHRTVYCYKNA